MVKAKHQKLKPKKQPQVKKKNGKQEDISEILAQLDALGLKIIEVTADGNCFFRALADQLEGNEDEHEKYRNMVVEFIKNNREMFEPFIEDEVPFDEYCQAMEKDGTWAGHMELQAASLVTRSNICIHRHKSPRWYIKNFDNREARMIHLSYHDGEHYNSVRAKDDSGTGPARLIVIKADADLSAASHQTKTVVNKSEGEAGRIQAGSVKMVIAGSGCEDTQKVEQVLQQVGGDVDAAIEYLIAEKGSEDYSAMNGHYQVENFEHCEVDTEDKSCEPELSCNNTERKHKKEQLHDDEQKIPRNKACPCGSKKKYKSCCGTAAGRSSARITVGQIVDHGKGQRNKKQGKKGGPANVMDSNECDGGPPDMGALCI